MKRYFLLFGSIYFLIFVRVIGGQEVHSGRWSIGVSSGFNYSVSPSMHGDIGLYEASLGSGTTPTQYPFGLNQAYGVGFEANIAYRFQGSPVSFYAGGYGSGFNAGYGFRNSPGGRFTMTIISAIGGIEYTFGQTYQLWNFYGRLGFVPSIISGSNRSGNGSRFSFDSLRINSIDSRLGMEIEIGERYHFSRLPFGIEASINYTNINLFGKSYSAPVFRTGSLFGGTSSINDGKNPSDPNDKPRTIDYLSIRVGTRFYF